MNTFSLNNNWTVEYFEPNIDGFEMAPALQTISHLPDWRCEARFAEAGFYAWLRCDFIIEPATECVRYTLQIENAPTGTKLYINDNHIIDCDDIVVRIDITDHVSLGTNRFNLRVFCLPEGTTSFDAINLLQIPCHEV